ncbi:hypothetical protein [Paraburkholderia aromaticivorans]|uniref:hypothetical protein n=1 Tax=Paraburkholderia aromaticivorans TaxID=2026199 RepID=UPI0038BC4FD3
MQKLLKQTFYIRERGGSGAACCALISPQRVELVSPRVQSVFDAGIFSRNGDATILLRTGAAYDCYQDEEYDTHGFILSVQLRERL